MTTIGSIYAADWTMTVTNEKTNETRIKIRTARGETPSVAVPTADLLAALDATANADVKHRATAYEDATRWQSAAEENERWADALKDRAEKAEAERDTLAATVERVRGLFQRWEPLEKLSGFEAIAVVKKASAALAAPESFTLPTEAGVRFYAEDPEGDSFVFKTLIGGREPLYIADDDQDQVCNADGLTGWQNFRLLDGAE